MMTQAPDMQSVDTSVATPPCIGRGPAVAWQLAALTAMLFLVFRHELAVIGGRLFTDGEAAHALAAPLLIYVLWRFRREAIASAMGPGSWWGVLLLVAAIGIHVLATWPFNYGYPRQAAIVPAMAGAIWALCGGRVARLCLPMLLIVLLAVPIGYRQYAFLIVRPETMTLSTAESILNMLPGVLVSLEGPDLFYTAGGVAGTIALGDPHRGASLFLAFLTIGVFVTSARIRPWWQIIVLGAAAVPIALLCNLARVLLQGIMTIYSGFGPLSGVPRTASAVLALAMCYGLFVLCALFVQKLVIMPEEEAAS
jgi:hypothetical protein